MNRNTEVRSRWLILSGRLAIGLVWLYQGAWLKVIHPSPQHLSIVSSVPFVSAHGSSLLFTIGIVETALGVWVLSGRALRAAAIVQTVLLVAMNSGGLLWGRSAVQDPAGMILQNFVFLVLVWFLAGGCHERNTL